MTLSPQFPLQSDARSTKLLIKIGLHFCTQLLLTAGIQYLALLLQPSIALSPQAYADKIFSFPYCQYEIESVCPTLIVYSILQLPINSLQQWEDYNNMIGDALYMETSDE